jgi:hypothetical protein
MQQRFAETIAQLRGEDAPGVKRDVVVGLPIENAGRTIFPVYREDSENEAAAAEHIGYIESTDGSTRYVTFDDPTARVLPIGGILFISAILGVLAWLLLRREKSGLSINRR